MKPESQPPQKIQNKNDSVSMVWRYNSIEIYAKCGNQFFIIDIIIWMEKKRDTKEKAHSRKRGDDCIKSKPMAKRLTEIDHLAPNKTRNKFIFALHIILLITMPSLRHNAREICIKSITNCEGHAPSSGGVMELAREWILKFKKKHVQSVAKPRDW